MNAKNLSIDVKSDHVTPHLNHSLSKAIRRLLYANVAVAVGSSVFGIPSLALADTATVSADDELTELVITARRRAIINAAERKQNSETMQDSIVGDDAGKLPDNSVTEVLQRIPGVTMTRFSGDPDHFNTEGSGIQIRGMSGVAGRLNGREVFSASGGWGLSWGDVTPELMAAVDVYKASTADQIEGGTGGQVDLRTKLPFDYADGFSMNGSFELNYGDLSKKTDPSASFMVAQRTQTGIGELGWLADVAFSRYDQESQFIRMEPYYRTILPNGTDGSGNPQYKDGFIPGGFAYGFDAFQRNRYGVYGALQWKPIDDLTITQTAFYSRYETTGNGMGIFSTAQQGFWGYGDWGDGPKFHGGAADGGSNGLAVNPAESVFDSNGALISSPHVFTRDPNTFAPSGVINAGGNSNYNKSNSWTRDLTTSFEWKATSNLAIRGGAQFVRSEMYRKSYDIFPAMNFPGDYSLDLSGHFPKVSFADTTAMANLSNYRMNAHMPALSDNKGNEKAFNLDADLALSEKGFFRSMRAGVRYAERNESDGGYYGWTNLCAGWDGCNTSTHTFDQAFVNPNDIQRQNFDNFFRGATSLPSGVWMPSLSLAKQLDPIAVAAKYGIGSNGATTIAHNSFQLVPGDRQQERSVNSAAYVMIRFANDAGLPFDGNVGIRAVRIRNTSYGAYDQSGLFATVVHPDGSTTREVVPGVPITNPIDGGIFASQTSQFSRGLPSVNVRFKPTNALQVRLAYNITLDQPSFYDTRQAGSVGVNLIDGTIPDPNDPTKTIPVKILNPNAPFSSQGGDPTLRPMISHNTDLSVEWYPAAGTTAHLSLFNKSIDGYLIYTNTVKPVSVFTTDGGVSYLTAAADEVANSKATTTAKGVEIGGSIFFDKLPGLWKGLGVDVNYTYVDSHAQGDVSYDIDGGRHNDTPIRGLSKNSYNVQLMYEREKVSVRLAWNWRSKYLFSTNTNGTNGSYTYLGAPGSGFSKFNDIDLPVYSDSFGQLDFGATYRPTKKLGISINFNNLLNAVPRTLMGGYPNLANGTYDHELLRSTFVSDRRVTLGVKFGF